MLDICYDPNGHGGSHHIEIVWGNDDKSGTADEIVNIRRTRIYEDIETAQTKIRAMRLFWAASKDVKITVSSTPSFIKEDVATRTWILCELLKGYVSSKNITIVLATEGMDKSISIIRKVFAARMLGMLPANVATPMYMAQFAKREFSRKKGCKVHIFDHEDLKEQKFGLILGIGDSARRSALPTFVFVERRGSSPRGPKVAIVGKGVTFDSGGLALKSFRSMMDMKYDKIGASYGMMILLHLIEDPQWKHVTFYGAFPFAENAISDTALHPGDVIRSYIGKTVEVANPDAEGRLIMADAMGYLHKYKPDLLIDVASLTGHASSINCWHHAYYFASTTGLKRKVEEIGEKNGERVIPMPMWTDYSRILKSDVADLNNSPVDCGDAFVASLFLKEFVPPSAEWVHFDLAHDISANRTPNGNSIRTIIGVVEDYLHLKDKK